MFLFCLRKWYGFKGNSEPITICCSNKQYNFREIKSVWPDSILIEWTTQATQEWFKNLWQLLRVTKKINSIKKRNTRGRPMEKVLTRKYISIDFIVSVIGVKVNYISKRCKTTVVTYITYLWRNRSGVSLLRLACISTIRALFMQHHLLQPLERGFENYTKQNESIRIMEISTLMKPQVRLRSCIRWALNV